MCVKCLCLDGVGRLGPGPGHARGPKWGQVWLAWHHKTLAPTGSGVLNYVGKYDCLEVTHL